MYSCPVGVLSLTSVGRDLPHRVARWLLLIKKISPPHSFFPVLQQPLKHHILSHPHNQSSVSLCKRSLYETTHVPQHTTHTNAHTDQRTLPIHENIAIMADQLNMNNLSLQESQHAPKPGQQQQNGGYGQGRSAYIPPHMRGARGGPAPGPPAFDGPPPMGGPGFGPPPGAQAKYAFLSSRILAQNNH